MKRVREEEEDMTERHTLGLNLREKGRYCEKDLTKRAKDQPLRNSRSITGLIEPAIMNYIDYDMNLMSVEL
jgi:hypothetical protein